MASLFSLVAVAAKSILKARTVFVRDSLSPIEEDFSSCSWSQESVAGYGDAEVESATLKSNGLFDNRSWFWSR